ncbi:MAG: hypothetical protein AUI14_18555 [Actinobacteria bacterium 13_2_20CM_2_71_6]|nr:MAG: hypothetical protein AUI14_18555 [Actinobacteria bacterium 13_2_20CM_2_71_6]
MLDRFGVPAQPAVRDTQVAQRDRRAAPLLQLMQDVQGPPVVLDRLGVPAQLVVHDRDVAQRPAGPEPVADRPVDVQRLPVVLDRLGVPALPPRQYAEAGQGTADPGLVPGLPLDLQRLPVVLGGLGVASPPPEDGRDVVQRGRLPGPVAPGPGGGEGVPLGDESVRVVATGVHVPPQRLGELAGVGGPALSRGEPDRGDQRGPVSVQPRPCGGRVGQGR